MGKQKRNADDMRRAIEAFHKSGLTRREFCQRHHIAITTLDYWRRAHSRQVGLVEVKMAASDPLCPICMTPFTIEALADKRLSVEHVPPKSVGGGELLLTCTVCNNSAGTKLDADAKTKEDVHVARIGALGRPHRIKALIGDLSVNGRLHTSGGQYSVKIPPHLNKPGTYEALRNIARAGTRLTVQHEAFSELGARISWLRSGYLTLFAEFGYKVALDPAMQIVRQQILECEERRMISFTSDAQQDIPLTVRRIMRVLDPRWHQGWVVQFGRYCVQFPSPGDMTFYERIAAYGLKAGVQNTTYEYWGWPIKPTFGLPQIIKPT